MMLLLLQIIVVGCFIVVIIALFRAQTDFLFYSMVGMLVAATATFLLSPDPISITFYNLNHQHNTSRNDNMH